MLGEGGGGLWQNSLSSRNHWMVLAVCELAGVSGRWAVFASVSNRPLTGRATLAGVESQTLKLRLVNALLVSVSKTMLTTS